MSFDLSYSFSDRLKKKRNVLLYNAAQETKYEKKKRSSYEQMRSIDQGETVFHEECPDVPWCGSTSPDLFIFKVMMNVPTTPITTILQYLPIINREGSFNIESNVTKESNYLVIRVRCTILRTDSLCDGISFYDVGFNGVKNTYIFNNFTTGLEIIQFGKVPLSRQGYQFKDLRIQFRNTIPVILSNTSLNESFMGSPMTSLNIGAWDVANVVSMTNAFTNTPSLVLDLSEWNVTIGEQTWYNNGQITDPLWV